MCVMLVWILSHVQWYDAVWSVGSVHWSDGSRWQLDLIRSVVQQKRDHTGDWFHISGVWMFDAPTVCCLNRRWSRECDPWRTKSKTLQDLMFSKPERTRLWACHVPPSLWWRDVSIWTDSGPKPTHLLSLRRRRLSEVVDDRLIQKLLATSLLKSCGLLRLVCFTFISPGVQSNFEFQTFLLHCCRRWMMCKALWDTPTVQVASDANLIHEVSQQQFACNFSVSSHFASSCPSGFSHVSQMVVSLF